MATRGMTVYAGVQLSGVTAGVRGEAVERWVAARCGGTMATTRDYDFVDSDGVHAEVKCGGMCYVASTKRWKVQFVSVKKKLHQRLYAALWHPRGIDVYRDDYEDDKKDEKDDKKDEDKKDKKDKKDEEEDKKEEKFDCQNIQFHGPCYEEDFDKAYAVITAKLMEKYTAVFTCDFSTETIPVTLTGTAAAYTNTPLAALPTGVRGDRIEEWVLKLLPPGARKMPPGSPFDIKAHNDDRVEVKSAQLRYQKSLKLWYVKFVGIKNDNWDHLIFVIFTPTHLTAWRTQRKPQGAVTTKGHGTKGRAVSVYAPRGETDIDTAANNILAKMSAAAPKPGKYVGFGAPMATFKL